MRKPNFGHWANEKIVSTHTALDTVRPFDQQIFIFS